MAIEDVLGGLLQLPLGYGNMQTNAYQPMYSYGQSQGANAMNLYGALAGQQANMYQAELPMQMEAQKWNAVAPLLSGLLGQFGLSGGGSLPSISFQSQRPDLMAGYNSAVGRYDNWMKDYFTQQQAVMPKFPQAPPPQSGPAPASLPYQSPQYKGGMVNSQAAYGQQPGGSYGGMQFGRTPFGSGMGMRG